MESVNVVARFRGAESGDDYEDWALTSTTISHKERHHDFAFDAVLDPTRPQSELYEKAGHNMIVNL